MNYEYGEYVFADKKSLNSIKNYIMYRHDKQNHIVEYVGFDNRSHLEQVKKVFKVTSKELDKILAIEIADIEILKNQIQIKIDSHKEVVSNLLNLDIIDNNTMEKHTEKLESLRVMLRLSQSCETVDEESNIEEEIKKYSKNINAISKGIRRRAVKNQRILHDHRDNNNKISIYNKNIEQLKIYVEKIKQNLI